MIFALVARALNTVLPFGSTGPLDQQESARTLEQRIRRYIRPRLLIIDEVKYLSYSARAADLMFQIVSRRYEHGATIVTTNVPFKDWGTVFPGAACASVMIDRLTHHAEIQLIEGESYRKKESAERSNRLQNQEARGAKNVKNADTIDVHVLTERDVGRIMAMLQALVSAVDTLFEARRAPSEEPEELGDHERMFDEAEARLFEDDKLDKIF